MVYPSVDGLAAVMAALKEQSSVVEMVALWVACWAEWWALLTVGEKAE